MKADGPEVTLKVALKLAPGATGPTKVFASAAVAVQPFGAEMLKMTPEAGAPVELTNVTWVLCVDPGENVRNPGGGASSVSENAQSRETSG